MARAEPLPLRDSAIILAIATALCFICGYGFLFGYYGVVGIIPADLGFPFFFYVEESIDVLLAPAMLALFALAQVLLVRELRHIRHEGRLPAGPEGRILEWHLLVGLVLFASLLHATFWFAAMNDSSHLIGLGRLTVFDAAIFLIPAVIGGILILDHKFRRILSGSYSWRLMAIFGVFLMLLGGALGQGTVRGQLSLSGCRSIPLAEFEPMPPGLDENATYWLVAHDEDSIILRDLGQERDGKGFVTLPESHAGVMEVSWTKPRWDKCPWWSRIA
jgi:hypothetical protein